MSVYILEDNVFQTNYLQKTIQYLCEKHHYDLGSVLTASHSQTLLEYCRKATEDANIYFLDIKIKQNETAGLMAAKQIRQLEPQAFIAFVTSYAEFALASYDYMTNAFAYILKTEDQEQFQEKINNCLQKYQQFIDNQTPLDYFIYKDRFTSIKLPYKELLYIYTVSQHKIGIKTVDQEIYFHGSLKEMAEREPRLLRCHQSYLVNLENAQMLDTSGKQIIFTKEIGVPVARKAMKAVQNRWSELMHVG